MMVGDRVGEEAAVEQLTKVEGEEEVEIKVADHLIELIMAVAVNKQIRIKESNVGTVFIINLINPYIFMPNLKFSLIGCACTITGNSVNGDSKQLMG